MLSSDDYAVAKRHRGDPATIQGCEADPKVPQTQGEARDSIQAERGKY